MLKFIKGGCMMYSGNSFFYVIVMIIVAIIVFIIAREFNCWYWKINKRLQLLEEINQNLKELLELQKRQKGSF